MRVLPLLPVPLTVAVLAVFRPGLLLAGATSLRGFLVMVGVGLVGLLVLAALWRRSSSLALWTASLVVLALMGALLWPAFRERTVVEAFPPVVEAAATASPLPSAVATPAPAAPRVPVATKTPVARKAPVATRAPVATKAPSRAPVAAASAVRLQSGSFRGIHHHAKGRASLYDLGSSLAVRFEKIDFQGTPAPSVHLVKRGNESPKGGIRLGGLKGEHGSFSYSVPAGFDPSRGWTVLVWCDTYATPIAAADLA